MLINRGSLPMTSQQQADLLLHAWQLQRALPPELRRLPQDNRTEADLDRDLAVIRAVIERRS